MESLTIKLRPNFLPIIDASVGGKIEIFPVGVFDLMLEAES